MTIPAPDGRALSRWGGRRERRRLAPAALALAVAAPLAGPAAAATGRGQSHRDTDVVAFARTLDAAWNARDRETVFALFAPDAAVVVGLGWSGNAEDGDAEYHGTADPFSLRAGVAVLMDTGVQIDPSRLEAAPVVMGGAAATRVRFPYQRAALLPGLPVEVGSDAVVLRGGRILAYTRTPDQASRAARAKALDGAMSAMATRSARSGAAPRGAAPRPPEPTGAAWPLALAGLALLAAASAARRRRPR